MSQIAAFDRRLKRLDRKHSRIRQNGYVSRMGRDGLVTLHPRRRSPRFPLGAVVAVAFLGVCFKSYLLASLGPVDYDARLDALRSGTLSEQAGAWLLAPDPASVMLADVLRHAI